MNQNQAFAHNNIRNQNIQNQIPTNHQRKSTQQEGQRVVRYIVQNNQENQNYLVVDGSRSIGSFKRDRAGGVIINSSKMIGVPRQQINEINQKKSQEARKGQRAARNNFQSMNVFNIANCDGSIEPIQNINQGIAITEFNDREDEDDDEPIEIHQNDQEAYEGELLLIDSVPQNAHDNKIYKNRDGRLCLMPNELINKRMMNQQIQYPARNQRPMVTEPVGCYGNTPNFNLVNIEEGDESAYDQTQDDQNEIEQLFCQQPQQNIGYGNFVYEKARKQSKNNKNLRDDVEGNKLIRNKSRDGIGGKRLMTEVQLGKDSVNYNKKRLSGGANYQVLKSQEQLNNQVIYLNNNDINHQQYINSNQLNRNNQVQLIQKKPKYPSNILVPSQFPNSNPQIYRIIQ